MKKAILLAFLVFVNVCPAVFAQSNVANKCSISAYLIDKDPNGTNVRDRPGVGGKILGKIKNPNEEENVMVEIVGYSNGWLKIASATAVDGDEQFSGTGWISAKMVAVNTESKTGGLDKKIPLYARPTRSSKKVGTVPNEIEVKIAGVDCFGIKIVYKGVTGWLPNEDFCGNPVTTCP